MKRRCANPGFSLLEVILSLSLSAVLLAAVGAAIDRAWRLSSQGQVEIQRQQVARAVLRIVERDLRSVMFVPPSEFADEEQGSSTSGTSSASTTSPSAASDGATTIISANQEALVLASRGIRGDSFTLEIDGARPQRELAYALPVNAAIPSARTSDLRTVMYQIVPPGQAFEPQGRGGLARKEGDRYAIVTAEEQGRSAAGSFSATVLAPEITALQFRYFDGMVWHAAWDSVAMGRLPRAVEVQIGFAPAEAKRSAWLNAAVDRSTEKVRLVIYVPAADPVPEEDAP
jgi:prepilin-type N-terminal cleavage/methylation domain-containing protein